MSYSYFVIPHQSSPSQSFSGPVRTTEAIFVVCIRRLGCIKGCHSDCCRREEERGEEKKRGKKKTKKKNQRGRIRVEEVQWAQEKSAQSTAVQRRQELSLKCQRKRGEQVRVRHFQLKSPTVTVWSAAGVNTHSSASGNLLLLQQQLSWYFNLTRHFIHEVQCSWANLYKTTFPYSTVETLFIKWCCRN